ncbi:MAG TPA: DUF3006 domain-containing protein [Bacillota bacterium]|jgi:hypothetical protein
MKVIVDRIEGELAVLEWGDSTVELPAAELPAGAREGSVLTVRLELDEDETARRRREAEATIKRLRGE